MAISTRNTLWGSKEVTAMNESILDSIKAMLGGNLLGEDTAFDSELIPLINMALNTLVQIGAGPSQGYNITSKDNVWSEFIGDDAMLLDMVKSYCHIKVKLLWDNSTTPSAVLEVLKEQLKELEVRISWRVDPNNTF